MEISRTLPARRVFVPATIERTTLLTVVLLGIVALLPRVLGLHDFLTVDEAQNWIGRTERFLAALQAGNWSGTFQAGHPGVTRMWLGSLGLLSERFALANGWIAAPTRLEHLVWLRLPSALLISLLIPISYLLLRRLVAPITALLGTLLWATSPMLISHERLSHVDGLLTSFVTLSVLSTLVACRSEHVQRWIVVSGVCAGLALLTKSPALILLPATGLLLFWLLPGAGIVERFWRSIRLYLLWLITAAIVVFALWPALWAGPGYVVARYTELAIGYSASPNGDGQFFFGGTNPDPGPVYYLVTNLLRLTPAATVGLLLLPLALRRPAAERRMLLAMGAFVCFWTLVMTMGAKKFDRYVLPSWPLLMFLAGAGLAWMLRAGLAILNRRLVPLKTQNLSITVGIGVIALTELAIVAWYHPYYLSYFNLVFGGGKAAQHVMLVGWGEGMNKVGAYLSERSDIDDGMILSALPPTLQPFVPVPVRDVTTIDDGPANYAVVYHESLQRGAFPEIYAQIRQTEPLHQITIHGIDYAWIHQLPRPFAQPIGAQFGDSLYLRGVTIEREATRLVVTPSWDVQGSLDDDYLLFLHLLDAQGNRVAQIDTAPGGADWPATSVWQPGQQIAVPLPLDLPADLPGGGYQLVMGLYQASGGARLPLVKGAAANPEHAGPEALLLDTVTLPK